ncbi:MAG: omptin family outer membrane protease, partial [candidate division Zixibacteria bacterium]|nr:omptin family outer membrane protease [candidate division Zixibacteria bacterium]
MIKKIALTSVCFLLLFSNVKSEQKFEWSFSPILQKNWGSTEYELNAEFLAYDPDSIIISRQIISILNFPLDRFSVGGEIGINSLDTAKNFWYAEITGTINITNPNESMTDTDWDKVLGRFDTKFSYTESNAELSGLNLKVEAGRDMFKLYGMNIGMIIGVKYQNLKFDINDFSGWQKPFDDINFVYTDSIFVSAYIPALTYDIIYTTPYVGFISHNKLNRNISLNLKAALQSVIVKDEDNHLLRKKISTSSGSGIGFLGGIDLKFKLQKSNSDIQPFIKLTGDINIMKVETNQTQTWYGDDPATPDIDDTGEVIDSVPHIFRSKQISAG